MADEQQDQPAQRDADAQDQHEDTHDTQPDADLGEKGKAALKAERDARKAAEKARADLEKRVAAFEQAQKDAEDAAAKEQGKWEEIAAKREQELADLRKQLADRDLADLRRTIARKHHLTDDALEFVIGEDEAAIEASVKKLAKLAAHREDVDTDSGKPNAGGGGTRKNESLLANYTFGRR